MTASQPLRDRYLTLIQATLLDNIYGQTDLETRLIALSQRIRHPYLTRRSTNPWPGRAHTMIGEARMANLRDLVERSLNGDIPGDFIETGAWRGGACIYIRAILAAHGVANRKVYVADSFEGLPAPDAEKYPKDKRDKLHKFKDLAVSEETVRNNFLKYGLLDEQVIFLKGFFRDTLPLLTDEKFALVRLDGDMYESTMDGLVHLYDRLSPNGYLIVDDYGALKNCAGAVHDFLDGRGLKPTIHQVDNSCVWWQKAAA